MGPRTAAALWVSACAALAACASPRDDDADRPGVYAARSGDRARAERAAPASTESEAFAFLLAVDDHEVRAGAEADRRRVRTEVRDFARRMQDDHGRHADETRALAATLGVVPAETPAVAALREKAARARLRLEGLPDAEFERAFVEQSVADHEEALAKLDALLRAPVAEGLRAHLVTTRRHVAHHLDLARKLRSGGAAR